MRVLLCPLSDPGYLYPSIAVGRELAGRRHTVRVLGSPAAMPAVAEAGLAFLPSAAYGGPKSFDVRAWFTEGHGQYQAALRAGRDTGADVLVTSVLCHGALLAAEALDVPVVVVGLAAYLWTYVSGGAGEPPSNAPRGWRTRSLLENYRVLREQVGRPARTIRSGRFPMNGDALLLRGDPVLEHPGGVLPPEAHHVGPCFWEPAPDPAELGALLGRLDQVGKPVVYVHLGRVFGGTSPWPRLNAAFTGGPFQAVVEQGRSAAPRPAPDADILVVRKPWMGPLIERAGLVLTSGTSAPVLGGLLRGRPLGVSPAGSEQPMLAWACVRTGVARHLPNEVSASTRAALESAWRDPGLRVRAEQVGSALARAGGARRAADIVQSVVTGGVAHAAG